MSIFQTKIVLKYQGGHPELPKAQEVTVTREGTDLVLSAGWLKKVKIPVATIRGLDLGAGHKRSAGKAVVGAVIGGALTGGIGALAGAAIGGRRREDNNATLTVARGAAEIAVVFADCNGDKYAKLAGMIS